MKMLEVPWEDFSVCSICTVSTFRSKIRRGERKSGSHQGAGCISSAHWIVDTFFPMMMIMNFPLCQGDKFCQDVSKGERKRMAVNDKIMEGG